MDLSASFIDDNTMDENDHQIYDDFTEELGGLNFIPFAKRVLDPGFYLDLLRIQDPFSNENDELTNLMNGEEYRVNPVSNLIEQDNFVNQIDTNNLTSQIHTVQHQLIVTKPIESQWDILAQEHNYHRTPNRMELFGVETQVDSVTEPDRISNEEEEEWINLICGEEYKLKQVSNLIEQDNLKKKSHKNNITGQKHTVQPKLTVSRPMQSHWDCLSKHNYHRTPNRMELMETPFDSENTVMPRSRGRPRGSKRVKSQNNRTLRMRGRPIGSRTLRSKECTKKRKRGRPLRSGNKGKSKLTEVTLPKSIEPGPLFDNQSDNEYIPFKHSIPNEVLDVKFDSKDSENTVMPRPRGRPRGSKRVKSQNNRTLRMRGRPIGSRTLGSKVCTKKRKRGRPLRSGNKGKSKLIEVTLPKSIEPGPLFDHQSADEYIPFKQSFEFLDEWFDSKDSELGDKEEKRVMPRPRGRPRGSRTLGSKECSNKRKRGRPKGSRNNKKPKLTEVTLPKSIEPGPLFDNQSDNEYIPFKNSIPNEVLDVRFDSKDSELGDKEEKRVMPRPRGRPRGSRTLGSKECSNKRKRGRPKGSRNNKKPKLTEVTLPKFIEHGALFDNQSDNEYIPFKNSIPN